MATVDDGEAMKMPLSRKSWQAAIADQVFADVRDADDEPFSRTRFSDGDSSLE